LKEYILTQLTRINYCKKEMDKIKQSNPKLAAVEDAREVPMEPKMNMNPSRSMTKEISSKLMSPRNRDD
jgi:hypothetical protein